MDQPRPRILVVDDDADLLVLLCSRLEQLGYAVRTATHGPQALNKLASEQPALILLDLRLPRLSGLDVLHQIKQAAPEITVIVMTAYASVEKAVEAMKAGAFDFLTKPLTPGHLELVVQKAFERQAMERAQHLLQADLDGRAQPIIGHSPVMRQAIEHARRAAQSSATVLLLGESGTGKEVFARAIHAWSPRRTQPFVVINCAALSDELIASDLFGHEKGAFTGAHQRKPGKLELAASGTVFLDEIGEMPATLQSKLLRVLQEHAFERVGGTRTIHIDIRVIAATNRNLHQAVTAGTFREDLFFRLHVIPLTLPDETLVYPAHGAGSLCGKNLSSDTCSPLGVQRRLNAALQPMSKAAFVTLVTADQPETPAYFAYAADLNRRQRLTLTQALEWTLTPLTCDQVVRLIHAGAQVVDARQPSLYATRHLTGSINIGLHGQYALWAGTVLDRHRPIVLIADLGREAEATLRLGRIGFDRVAGYLAGGMHALAVRPELTRWSERVTPLTLAAALASADPPLLLDVRTAHERHTRYIAGSLHIPLQRLQRQMHDVPRGRKIVVYCAGGYRSSLAVSLLEQHGIAPLADLDGGMTAWADAALETLGPEAISA